MTPGFNVNIDVPDLSDAIRFYVDGLGFKRRRSLFDSTVAEVALESTLTYLIYRLRATRLSLISRLLGITKAIAAGATKSAEVLVNEWGKPAALRDPFGHSICLLAFVGKGCDEVAD